MAYRAFYTCYETNRIVAAERAHEFNLDAAASLAADILRNDEDFFGLIDEQGQTLQFMREGEAVWMEIPVPAERGSYGTTIAIDEVPTVIASLPPSIERDDFSGLEFQAW